MFFSRLFIKGLGANYDSLFKVNKKDISYLDTINNLYKAYKENKELFVVDKSFDRYKYFNNNIYMSRISDESDIIGYYIGDNTVNTSFINNYGYKDYQKRRN